MIRLGLRLAVAGGREAVVRLALIAAAVAVGVGLLLGVLSAVNAVQSQNQRYAWLNSGVLDAATGSEAADPAWWGVRKDFIRGHPAARIDVAATGPDAPVPPGLPGLPGPGEYYASPALSRLLAIVPAGELADRFGGRQVGVLGTAALPSPDSLIVVVGRTPAEAARLGATEITRIAQVDPADCAQCDVGIDGQGLVLVLAVVTAALLFPLLMFIGTATRLSAARREQRFAAMRLIGATPRQISVLAVIESTVAAAVGMVLGFALFLPLRTALDGITFTGERFFPADLALTVPQILAVALGVPLGAAAAAQLALRRVRISPFGVTRRATPQPPRPVRLLPLVVGLAELGYFVARRPDGSDAQAAGYLSGILLVMTGLVVAGPYLTMLGSRLLAARAQRPAALIAGRRLADDPRAGFRAVSGLMLALFVTSVATGVITSITAEESTGPDDAGARGTLSVFSFPDGRPAGQPPMTTAAIPAGLAGVPGVRQVQVVRLNPAFPAGQPPGLIACADLARTPHLGTCPAGAEVARVSVDLSAGDDPPAVIADPMTAGELARQPVLSVVVDTDGSTAALERTRTLLQQAFPDQRLPITAAEWNSDFSQTLAQYQRLADVVIMASLLIAGCSLAVSITGGLNERRRPFSLLRLAGVRLAELRRVVALESAVPLLAVAVVAIAAGFVAAHLFLRAQLQYPLHPPGAAYYVIVLLGLTVSLGLIGSTMPLLRRITGPETARSE